MPPHFLPDEPLLTDVIWRDILPEYGGLPASFKAALPYLLASLVYHKTILISTLCSDHPIFLSRVWTTGIMNDLSSKVLAGCGRNPISQMAATGIPPTLVLANQMDMLSEKVTRLEDNFQSRQDEFVETLSSNMESLSSKLDQLPETISCHIQNCLQVTGEVSATAGDVSSNVSAMLVGVQKTLLDAITEA